MENATKALLIAAAVLIAIIIIGFAMKIISQNRETISKVGQIDSSIDGTAEKIIEKTFKNQDEIEVEKKDNNVETLKTVEIWKNEIKNGTVAETGTYKKEEIINILEAVKEFNDENSKGICAYTRNNSSTR